MTRYKSSRLTELSFYQLIRERTVTAEALGGGDSGDRLSDVLCLSISSSQIFQLLFNGKRYAKRACM